MSWSDKIIAAHTAVTESVSHMQRLKSKRYFVWQEDGVNDLLASNKHVERAVTGYTDLFTTMEFDPWANAFEKSLTDYEIAWSLRDIQYEEDTGITHYTWDWEVLDGNDSV